MRLEKIEITNFKSYKGTYTLGPFDKFSCIIGPNGSGKSNILDAISFVLNVPNNFLRVKYLKNLIAHGETEARVKIYIGGNVFERTITENIRNSENASILADDSLNYDINSASTCRYYFQDKKILQKEYNKELEKLNILNKIRNFVIYQGDIIKSDVNLLSMIEHICGSDAYIEEYNILSEKITNMNKDLSLKYEKRKDMVDLIKEMQVVQEKEKNFEALIVQKETLQKKLYEAEISKKQQEIKGLKEKLEKLEEIKKNSNYDELSNTVNKIRAEAATLQKEYFEKETELSFAKSKKMRKPSFDTEAKNKELKALQESLNKTNEEISKLKLPLDWSKFRFDDGQLVTREVFDKILLVKEKEYFQNISGLEKQLAQTTLANFDKITRRDQLSNTIKQMNLKRSRIIARNKEIEAENILKLNKIASIDREVSQLRSQIEERVDLYERIVSDEERLNKELNDVTREILINKAKKNDLTKRSLVKSVVENLKNIFSGVHGRVLDIIEPTQKKYEISVGLLLSKYDQAVVVDTEKTALDCLRYIKDSKSCKLTFLALDRIKDHSVEEDLKENEQNIKNDNFFEFKEKMARNCITYDTKFECVFRLVFRNSLIVDTSDQAKHILYNRKYPGAICTLDGTLFTDSGLITGGKATVNKFEEGLIDNLLNRRKTISNNLKAIRDRREALSDVENVKLRIDSLVSNKLSITMEQTETGLLNELNTDALINELRVIDDSLIGHEEVIKRIQEAKKQIERGIFTGLMNTIGLNSVSEYRDMIKKDLKREELNIKVGLLKHKISTLREEISSNITSAVQEMDIVDINSMENELNNVYMALEEVKEKLRIHNATLKNLSQQRSEINKSILNYQLHIARDEDNLKDILQLAELEFNIKDEFNLNPETINVSEKELANIKSKIEKIDLELAENVPTVISNDSTVQQRFARVNREYEVAKEELNTLKKRFIEIKRIRMETFSNCFSAVSSEIPAIYKRLTRDEESETQLESNSYLIFEGDPFINNVKYYLMPPGKRFTPFNELSGGEKSIALLSFIFALSRYRKPPFYIFDEIDSALDKLNVENLGKYLIEQEDQSLVVSLKSQLFSKAESLFGVYKCPKELRSKVLSLKLIN